MRVGCLAPEHHYSEDGQTPSTTPLENRKKLRSVLRLDRLAGAFERAPTFDAETGIFRLEFRADHTIKAPTEIFIPEVVQYPEGFVVELSDGDYKLERAPDAVGGYCILRYTPGPPGYVSIVVVKRVGADDPPGRSCCAHSPDEALLPSKPSSETLIDAGN